MEHALTYPVFLQNALHGISAEAVFESELPSLSRLINVCNTGVPAHVATDLRNSLDAPKTLFSAALGISTRTYERYVNKPDEHLKSAPSDRLLHLIFLTKEGTEVFGNFDVFKEWMNEANEALDGKKPIELITTQFGIDAIKDLLVQIEWGELS